MSDHRRKGMVVEVVRVVMVMMSGSPMLAGVRSTIWLGPSSSGVGIKVGKQFWLVNPPPILALLFRSMVLEDADKT